MSWVEREHKTMSEKKIAIQDFCSASCIFLNRSTFLKHFYFLEGEVAASLILLQQAFMLIDSLNMFMIRIY